MAAERTGRDGLEGSPVQDLGTILVEGRIACRSLEEARPEQGSHVGRLEERNEGFAEAEEDSRRERRVGAEDLATAC